MDEELTPLERELLEALARLLHDPTPQARAIAKHLLDRTKELREA